MLRKPLPKALCLGLRLGQEEGEPSSTSPKSITRQQVTAVSRVAELTKPEAPAHCSSTSVSVADFQFFHIPVPHLHSTSHSDGKTTEFKVVIPGRDLKEKGPSGQSNTVAQAQSNISDIMESGKMASPKSMPEDAQMMAQILKDMGITEYEPRVINDANIYSSHAKKATIDADDVRLAIQCCADQSFTSPSPGDFLLYTRGPMHTIGARALALAAPASPRRLQGKEITPLPLIKPYSGPRLPPGRYYLTAPDYRLKSLQKKASTSVGRISSTIKPSTPTLGTPTTQTMSVSTKVGTPMSLTGQRFTVQMSTSQSPAVKASIPVTSAVQNVLINPSLIGSKHYYYH
ncbi:hypothetical protein QTO34_010557 [Cnephaeus nilssonii]|uniref:Uncharacterized protein n=1 Tax=Cnephaeus nilssonii TaxID=3371016 RepID=A0AA40HFU5_CNENI|nr:hypothetical protein QTO34_010557 [Eptesicus nilssonii]